MADGDGGIARASLLHHEEGRWFADDLAAAEHDDVLAFGFDAAALDELDDAGGGAGYETAAVFLAEFTDVDRIKAVDVLAGKDTVEGFCLVDMLGQRCLDEDAVDVGVGIQCIDLGKECFFGNVLGEQSEAAFDADAFGGFLLLAYVGYGCGVIAYADERDHWFFTGKGADFDREFFDDGCCDCVAVDELHADFCLCWKLGREKGLLCDSDGASLNDEIVAAGNEGAHFADHLDCVIQVGAKVVDEELRHVDIGDALP